MAKGLWNIGGFNIPDFHISESLGLTQANTGGLIAANPAVINPSQPAVTPTYNSGQTQSQIANQNLSQTQFLSGNGAGSSNGTGGNNGQVLGSNVVNNPPSPTGPNPEDTARSQSDAELQSALNEFENERSQMLIEQESLGRQKTNTLSSLGSALGKSQEQAKTAESSAETETTRQKSKALSTAQDVQRSNRNVLRALGILSSSAAGEMLGKPMNEFATQAADLGAKLIERKNYIQDWLGERVAEHQSAVAQVEENFNTLSQRIAQDLRFNTQQKSDAIRQAKAALSANISEIQRSMQQYQLSAQQYSDSILQQIAQLQLYQNPQADVSGIQNTLLSRAMGTGNYTPQQVGVEQKKKESPYG